MNRTARLLALADEEGEGDELEGDVPLRHPRRSGYTRNERHQRERLAARGQRLSDISS